VDLVIVNGWLDKVINPS